MPSDTDLPEPFERGAATVRFTTDDSWSAYELSAALASLDRTYLAIVLARYLAVEARENAARVSRALLSSPLYSDWIRLVREFGVLGATPFMPWLSPDSDHDVDRLLAEPGLFIESADELTIERVQMASPGGFSLKGLGEPIRQLRELIKDLFYRNRQERERGELALIRERLQLISDFRLPEASIQKLSDVVIDELDELRPLVSSRKLRLAGGEGDDPVSEGPHDEQRPRPRGVSRKRRTKK